MYIHVYTHKQLQEQQVQAPRPGARDGRAGQAGRVADTHKITITTMTT